MTLEERPLQLDFEGCPALSLRRIHLRSVGPRAARMDPFDLRHETPEGTASRVLWSLTNTGGKTTLLRLVTSVVVPAARAQMGGANIGEYVDTGDTSHVVLEWDIAGGDRFVTGGAYEWPGRKRPSSAPVGELRRFFYMFRCNGVGVDDLPFALDGRRRTLEEFRNAVRELMADYPAAQFVSTVQQSEWASLLDTRTPLDPELFRYQMRMNDDESGSEALVRKLTSPDAIVRFFIEALNDDTGVAEFTDTLADYARQSAQRSAWTLEAAFCDALIDRLGLLGEAHVVRRKAREEATVAHHRIAELAGELHTRMAADTEALETLRDAHQKVDAEATRLDGELKRQSDLRQQLLLEDARFDAAASAAAHMAAMEARDWAEATRDAWAATDPVALWRAAQARARESQAAYAKVEGELIPLRRVTHDAAAALAAKYAALAEEAVTAERAAKADLKEAGDARRAADEHVIDAVRAQQDAESRLAAIVAAATDAAAAHRRLVTDGHADASETADAALARWTAAVDNAAEVTQGLAAERDEAILRRYQATATKETRRDVLGKAAGERDDTRRQLDAYFDALAAVAADDDVAAVADNIAGAPIDDARVAAAVAAQAAERAGAEERSAAEAEAALAEVETQLARLERGDLLATREDIEAVRRCLVERGVGAVTAWEWMARNIADPDERRRRIAARPDVANGVIVTDAARLADARTALNHATLDLRIAVLVTPSSDTGPRSEPAAGFVVEPHRALWDREWAERTREEMRARRDRLFDTAETARTSAGHCRRATVKLDEFTRRWPAIVADRLPGNLAVAEEKLASADTAFDAATAACIEAEGDVTGAQNKLNDAIVAAAAAGLHAEACRHPAGIAARAGELAATRPAVEADGARATISLEAGRAARDAADEAAAAAQARIATARAQGEAHRERQLEVGVEPAGEAPDTPVHELRAVWEQLRADLEAAEAGSDHAARLDEANQRAAEAAVRVQALDASAVAAAEGLLATFEASTPGMRAEELRRAEAALRKADTAVAEAQAWRKRADANVVERTPTDRQIHHSLEGDWVVADRTQVAERLERLAGMTAEHRSRLTEAQTTLAALTEQLTTAETDIERVGIAAGSLDADPLPGMRAFEGTPRAAQEEAQRRVAARRRAEEDSNAAEERWREALAAARATANSSKWSMLESPWKERCLHGDSDTTGAEAATWADRLRIRSRSLADDLADLDRHRDLLVLKLEHLCTTQLRLLREVTSASRLPEQMGELSRQAAFKVDFDKAPPVEARARLAARVDRWAEELAADPKKAGRGDQRYRWLADATKDLVIERPRAGSWSVQVLKPVIDGAVEYRTPDRIEIEFSGGQELTLAVLLYCTLSQVRAQNRTTGARPAGVLLLDNPFGRASNAALIRMQQALAARAGLQLVCATAISDPSVKTAFEGDDSSILELRNDRDQRRGLQYLRVADPHAAALVAGITAGRDPASTDGYLDGTRYRVHRLS